MMTRNKRPTRQKMIMIERVTNSCAVPHPPLTLQSQAILEGGAAYHCGVEREEGEMPVDLVYIAWGCWTGPSPLPGVEEHHRSGATRQLAGAARRRRRALTGRQHPRPALAASWGVLGADG